MREEARANVVSESNLKLRMQIILLTVFLDGLSFSLLLPITPSLVQHFTGTPASATFAMGLLIASYSFAQFIAGPIIGVLSDLYGRRPVILLTLTIGVVDYVFSAIAWELWLLFAARIIAGVCGGNITAVNAYVADISKPEERSQKFGLVLAALAFGFIIGPGIGGYLVQWGLRTPFWISAGLGMLNLGLAIFFLTESRPKSRVQQTFALHMVYPLQMVLRHPSPDVRAMLRTVFFLQTARAALQATFVIFTFVLFNWNEADIGIALVVSGIFIVLAQGGLTTHFVDAVGNTKTAIIGLVILTLGYAALGFVSAEWQLYAALIFWSLGMICEPAIQGAVSRRVSDEEQGVLQGNITSLTNLGSILGPIAGASLFSLTSAPIDRVYLPGAPFLLCACLTFVALWQVFAVLRSSRADA
jgi:DHA1 family tetracycline resistance protein-like MFS transporter